MQSGYIYILSEPTGKALESNDASCGPAQKALRAGRLVMPAKKEADSPSLGI